jgi:pimeloyl-ACP methyl ester carboxylesterase
MVLLDARGYRAIAPDLPGYGASARFDGSYSLPFYSDFIRDFIRELGYSRVVLSGLSLGGGITLKAAID